MESPDTVRTDQEGVLFYHKNGETCLRYHAELQALDRYIDVIPDTLSNRIFGGYLSMTDSVSTGERQLESLTGCNSFVIKLSTHSAQVSSPEEWIESVIQRHHTSAEAQEGMERTGRWWEEYWLHSWLFVEGDHPGKPAIDPSLYMLNLELHEQESTPKSSVTQAYLLSKWMLACVGRGEFPILFTGALFNVMPGDNQHYSTTQFGTNFTSAPAGEPSLEFNPDERSWWNINLWQNQRLPYHSMLARGEVDSLKVLFRYYRRFWEINRIRARVYHGAEGQHNTEITMTLGLMPALVYGHDRTNLADGYSVNRMGGAIDISPGLELVHLLLMYYEHTSD